MRLYKMVCTELLVLGKNGIVVLYGIVTLLYLFVLSMVPEQSRKIVAVIVIFTDPVTLGLFLMGAIILMERNQRLTDIYSVTPIKIHEYILAKVIPMLIIGMFFSLVLGLYAGCAPLFFVLVGVMLLSFIFSMIGICISFHIHSLNQFVLYSVPVELVSFVPAIVALYKIIPMNDLKLLHPGIAGITLLYSNESVFGYAIASLVFWSVIIFKITVLNVEKGYERWWSK